MNTGEIVRDGQGHQYKIGPILGRGLWGKTYTVQTEDEVEWALKIPLSPSDLPDGHEKLAQVSRKILVEQGNILSDSHAPQFLAPRLQFTTKEGIPCLLFPKLESNLEQRLQQGCSLREILAIAVQLVEAIDSLPLSLSAHGNLHPRNVFLASRTSVKLSDPITPTLTRHYAALRQARETDTRYMPPEARELEVGSPQQVYVDT